MSISILMAGNDEMYLSADRELLKNRGIRVYTCTHPDNLPALMAEVRPDLVFLNYPHPAQQEMSVYRKVLDNSQPGGTPVIFTVAEDEAYLVSRKRNPWASRWEMVMADNITDAIKQALHAAERPVSRRTFRMTRTIWLHPRLYASA